MDQRYIIRKGTVTNVNNDEHTARVKYEDLGYTSGWLKVPGHAPYFVAYDGEQRTEYEEGGSGEAAYQRHRHLIKVIQWMPKIGDIVVVAYEPVENGDGYVLGGLY